MRQIALKVPVGSTLEIAAPGNYIRVNTAAVTLRIEAPEVNASFDMSEGDAVELQDFQRLRITHSDAAEQSIVLLIGKGSRYTSSKVEITSAIEDIAVVLSGAADVTIKQGATLTAPAAVSVGVAATALVAADATRRSVRFFNAGTVAVYLGPAGVTTANGAVMINPQQLWIETEAAAAAWYGISGTAGQSVRIQEVLP
jgi:hypothetical protein